MSLTSSYVGSWLCRSFFDVFVDTHFLFITQIINPIKTVIKTTPEISITVISEVFNISVVKPTVMNAGVGT